jgi:hypothetical protein
MVPVIIIREININKKEKNKGCNLSLIKNKPK